MFSVSVRRVGGATGSTSHQYSESWLSWVQLSSGARCSFSVYEAGFLDRDIVLVAGSGTNSPSPISIFKFIYIYVSYTHKGKMLAKTRIKS